MKKEIESHGTNLTINQKIKVYKNYFDYLVRNKIKLHANDGVDQYNEFTKYLTLTKNSHKDFMKLNNPPLCPYVDRHFMFADSKNKNERQDRYKRSHLA